jgi:hypothetical protein
VIRRYGVLHAGAGENGRDIARPAEFLVDASGTVRWVNLTDDICVRARPEVVLREIERLPHLGLRFSNPLPAPEPLQPRQQAVEHQAAPKVDG